MTQNAPPELLKLLAHDLRWQMLQALAASDMRVNELVALVGEPANLVSYHLKQLREADLVVTRRSDADGRDVYYSLDVARLADLYCAAGEALHAGIGVALQQVGPPPPVAVPLRVLVVCTRNSARSQMAEAMLRHYGGPQMAAFSAGSKPDRVHPLAIETMESLGIDIRHQQSKGLATFEGQAFDYVITVCDQAREVCPTFPGGVAIHWSLPDPASLTETDAARAAFTRTAQDLQRRITHFLTRLAQTAA